MVDQNTFQRLYQYTDNFKKIKNTESSLIYSNYSMDAQPWLTILVITYRRSDMLKDAIKSIIRQESVKYPWEIVIMDNDSESVLPSWIKSMTAGLNIRYYVNSKNLGHEGNMNRGIQLSRGEWVALLHDDDLLVVNYLQLVPAYIEATCKWRTPVAYIRANYEEFYGAAHSRYYDKPQRMENVRFWKKIGWLGILLAGIGPTSVNSCGSLVNRQYFINIGGYNEIFNPIADSTLGLIFMNNGYSIAETSVPLGYYRQGNNASSKLETIYDFLVADYYLREFFYQRNLFTKMFGICFKQAQFHLQLQQQKKKASFLGMDLKENALCVPVWKKRPVVRMKLLVLFRRIYLALNRPYLVCVKWRKRNESRNFSWWIWDKN